MTDENGDLVDGNVARAYLFGAYREQPDTNPDVTDRGYTGHRMNNTGGNDIGLVYMQARFYAPELRRFISADTIVPEPGNPQSFNRYAYVHNDTINFTDPSGHNAAIACIEDCGGPPRVGSWTSDFSGWAKNLWGQLKGGVKWAFGGNIGTVPAQVPTAAYQGTMETTGALLSSASSSSSSGAVPPEANGSTPTTGGFDPNDKEDEFGVKGEDWKRFDPMNGPGPLNKDAQTFRSATYYETKLAEDLVVHRQYGGNDATGAGAIGNWWTTKPISGPMQGQMDSAILPEWGNTLQNVSTAHIPAGTTVYVGYAGPQTASSGVLQLAGGGVQIYIPGVNPTWMISP
jgi:RHS repeat-associated protein